MTADRGPNAPHGLGARSKRLWKELHAEFDFSNDPHRLAILVDACRTLDLIDRLQKKIDALGDDLRVRGSTGQWVSAPELAEIRSQRSLFAALMKNLALPETPDVAGWQAEHSNAKRREPRADHKQLKLINGSG